MSNRRLISQKKASLMCMFLLAAGMGIADDTAVKASVQKLAQKAFAQKNEAAIREAFEKNLTNLPTKQEQQQALLILAEYERHAGSYANAAAHYRQAAKLDTNSSTEILLEAVRTLLCGADFNSARSLLSEIAAALPVSEENPYYRTAAVYDAWRLLAEDRADRAVPLIAAYTKKKAFTEYHPALLFTLWWVNGNEEAKRRLLKEFPSSMETAAVQGSVTVQPSAFWYLMPRSGDAFEQQEASAANQGSDTEVIRSSDAKAGQEKQSKPLYYQLGFYRIKKYAESLAADLRKNNFIPLIKEETRPSGTVYFAVLVEENAAGDIGLRLKGAGYEAFPIFP